MNLLSRSSARCLAQWWAVSSVSAQRLRHWHRDRVLEAWTNVLDELAVLSTFLPPIDPTAVANPEDIRDQVERQLHAQVTSLDRRISVLELLGDDEACALLTEVHSSLWDAVFLIMPRSAQVADQDAATARDRGCSVTCLRGGRIRIDRSCSPWAQACRSLDHLDPRMVAEDPGQRIAIKRPVRGCRWQLEEVAPNCRSAWTTVPAPFRPRVGTAGPGRSRRRTGCRSQPARRARTSVHAYAHR